MPRRESDMTPVKSKPYPPPLLITSSSGSYITTFGSPNSDSVSTLTPSSTPSPQTPRRQRIRNSSVIKGAEIVRAQILSGQLTQSWDRESSNRSPFVRKDKAESFTPQHATITIDVDETTRRSLRKNGAFEDDIEKKRRSITIESPQSIKKYPSSRDNDRHRETTTVKNKDDVLKPKQLNNGGAFPFDESHVSRERRGKSNHANANKNNDGSRSNVVDNVRRLRNDPPFRHATRAGLLWQSIVGDFVRFPSSWYDGRRTPPMGSNKSSKWKYVYESLIKSSTLTSFVPSDESPGRLLLHVIVQDLMTMEPGRDIAIGCFHPKAKGVTMDVAVNESKARCRRFVWMAVRKRTNDGSVSLIDPILFEGKTIDEVAKESPLGGRRTIGNSNIRSIFGDDPPLDTVFILESDLFKMIQSAKENPSMKSMSLGHLLLHGFTISPRR